MRILLVLLMVLGAFGTADAKSKKPIHMVQGEDAVQQVVTHIAIRALGKAGFKTEIRAVARPDLIGGLVEGDVHAHPTAFAAAYPGLMGAIQDKTIRSLGGVSTNSPDEDMLKLVWPGMKKRWPDAQKLLKRMVITVEDLAAFSEQLAAGEGPEDVAGAWWGANKKSWKPWIAASKNWMKP